MTKLKAALGAAALLLLATTTTQAQDVLEPTASLDDVAVPILIELLQDFEETEGPLDYASTQIVLNRVTGPAILSSAFVYNDPRRMARNGGDPNITYEVVEGRGTADQWYTADYVQQGRDVFEQYNAIPCGPEMTEVHFQAPGALSWGETCGALNDPACWPNSNTADRADATWYGFPFFGQLPPWCSATSCRTALGVSVTYAYRNPITGRYTDANGDGLLDVAFREQYLNDRYRWCSEDGPNCGRLPSGPIVYHAPFVLIHETGHSLNLGHFGSQWGKDGALKTAPDNVMPIAFSGVSSTRFEHVNDSPRTTGSFCHSWARWETKGL